MSESLLSVRNLSIGFLENRQYQQVVHGVSFDLKKNEILGIVGESGSGKSITSLALLGLLSGMNAKVEGDSIRFQQQDLLTLSPEAFRALRGKEISMIFQDPMSSLNPSMRCGKQLTEVLLKHTSLSAREAKQEALSLFEKVKLPDPETVFQKYPHELSGGQKQRVMIAIAISCKPRILIADEPTTALDVTVQKDIILLLKQLQAETGMSILFISHDLALVSDIADHLLVMYQGRVVEQGNARDIFTAPQHSYTQALLHARPSMKVRLKRLPTIKDHLEGTFHPDMETTEEREARHQKLYAQTPLLEVVDLEKEYTSGLALFKKKKAFKAVKGVSFKLYEGETLGLVGESGCGKSTLGNAILQLDPPTAGKIFYRGMDLTQLGSKALKALRKEIQIIFQDPYSSLNPRIPVGKAIMEPMKVHRLYTSDAERKEKVLEILNRVGLKEEHFNRYPHEFSGGQRQRIGIARTIALRPKLIVCDESVSALDISVQAQVLNLLNELKESFGFTYIFISHDLAVVKYMSDQLLVMNKGIIEEYGNADDVYAQPVSAYTQKLIDAIPKGH